MENNLPQSNKQNIAFIPRKKNISNIKKLENYIESFHLILLAKLYKKEKLLFRVIYDKNYRTEMFDFIISANQTQINIARNLFTMNETNFPLKYIKSNLDLHELDDDLHTENNFLNKIYYYYCWDWICFLAYIPGLISYIFLRVNSSNKRKNAIYFYSFLSYALGNFIISSYFDYKRQMLYSSFTAKELQRKYQDEMDTYKNFFYDD